MASRANGSPKASSNSPQPQLGVGVAVRVLVFAISRSLHASPLAPLVSSRSLHASPLAPLVSSRSLHASPLASPGSLCALPLDCLQEVIPFAALTRPPALPALLEGFLNLGGSAIPVVRLDRLLGLPETAISLHTPLLLLKTPGGLLALLVESVRGLGVVSEICPVEGHSFNHCIAGEARVGPDSVFLLAPDRIFLEKERRRLADLQVFEQERLRLLQEPGQ